MVHDCIAQLWEAGESQVYAPLGQFRDFARLSHKDTGRNFCSDCSTMLLVVLLLWQKSGWRFLHLIFKPSSRREVRRETLQSRLTGASTLAHRPEEEACAWETPGTTLRQWPGPDTRKTPPHTHNKRLHLTQRE